MINQSFCLSLLIFWVAQYNASAFLPVATYQGVRANAARGKVFSKRALRYNSPLKLDDNPDGSKLENLAYLSNATVTTKNDATNSHDTTEDLEEGQDAEFSAEGLGRSNWTRNFYEYANAAAGTLGDIMSRKPEDANDPNTASSSTFTTADGAASGVPPPSGGLVTTAIPSGSLASRFGIDHPLDRMALTANGNLQRLVSSYYDAPVQVVVDACDKIILPHNSDGDGLVQNKDNDKTDAMAADNDSIIHRPYAVQTAKQWDRVVHLSVHNQVCSSDCYPIVGADVGCVPWCSS